MVSQVAEFEKSYSCSIPLSSRLRARRHGDCFNIGCTGHRVRVRGTKIFLALTRWRLETEMALPDSITQGQLDSLDTKRYETIYGLLLLPTLYGLTHIPFQRL